MPRFIYTRQQNNRTLTRPRYYRNASPELVQRAQELCKSATPAEQMLREAIRSRQFYGLKFRFRHVVETFILDFYCASCRLVIEVDGSIHRSPDVAEHDALRSVWLKNNGYTVLRFTNEEIYANLPQVLHRILETAQPNSSPASGIRG